MRSSRGRPRRARRSSATPFQPSARARPSSRMICSTSMTTIDSVFAVSSLGRPSGVIPSRLSTPYWRSNAVPIESCTIPVDITASATMPGNRKSIGWRKSPFGSTSTDEKNPSSNIGMPRMRSSDSPRRKVSTSSARVWASECAHPDFARRCVRDRRRGLDGDGAMFAGDRGEAKEHVFEPLPSGSEIGQGKLVLGEPCGERGDVGRCRRHRDLVLAGSDLVDEGIEGAPETCGVELGGAPNRISSLADDRMSSAGVPLATTWPRSMMTMRSAMRSASSRSCVVTRTRDARLAQLADELADDLAAGDVDASRGLVEEHDFGSAHERERERQALLLATRQPAPDGRAAMAETDTLEQRVGILGLCRSTKRTAGRPRSDGCRDRRRRSATSRPLGARTLRGRRCGSRPSTRTWPLVGRRNPSRVSTVVVLPAPLGPSSASTSPGATENDTWSTAMRSP